MFNQLHNQLHSLHAFLLKNTLPYFTKIAFELSMLLWQMQGLKLVSHWDASGLRLFRD